MAFYSNLELFNLQVSSNDNAFSGFQMISFLKWTVMYD